MLHKIEEFDTVLEVVLFLAGFGLVEAHELDGDLLVFEFF